MNWALGCHKSSMFSFFLAHAVQPFFHSFLQSALFHNVRFGCTIITVDALVTPSENDRLFARGSKGLLDAAIARGAALFPPTTFEGPNGRVLAQLGEDACVVSSDVALSVRLGLDSQATPRLHSIAPFAALPGNRRGFTLRGASIAGGQDMVVCRCGSDVPDLEVLRSGHRGEEEFVDFVVPRLSEGLHFVEVQRGALLSSAAPFVVVNDGAAVAELRQLEWDASGIGAGEAVSSFVRNVGIVLEWLRLQNGASPEASSFGESMHCAETARRVSAIAQRLVATCAARGWPALLRLVLPAIMCSDGSPASSSSSTASAASLSAAIDGIKSFSEEGFSLLHLVAISRCAATVPVLSEWGTRVGHTWRCEPAAPLGLTPLHLASILDDGGAMALALTGLFPDGPMLWCHESAIAPYSPAAFASYLDNTTVLAWLVKEGVAPFPVEEAALARSEICLENEDVAEEGNTRQQEKSDLPNLEEVCAPQNSKKSGTHRKVWMAFRLFCHSHRAGRLFQSHGHAWLQ